MNKFKNIILPVILMLCATAFIVSLLVIASKPDTVDLTLCIIFLVAILIFFGGTVVVIKKVL